jgi:hypothetical protein
MLRRLFLCALAGVCLSAVPPAAADPRLTVMVMQEDADYDALPRGTALSTELSAAIAEVFATNGMTAVVDTDAFPELVGRVRMPGGELLGYSERLVDPPVDAVVLFTVFAAAQSDPFVPGVLKLQTRLTGRLVALNTRATLATFTDAHLPMPLEQGCDRSCLMQATATQGVQLARDFAQAMVTVIGAE